MLYRAIVHECTRYKDSDAYTFVRFTNE
eukprot:COSAG02_NODE_73781_length_167_cov_15.661765_1_plen_27_part_10